MADEEEDYIDVPAWTALYPITQIVGNASECVRQMPGLQVPDGMAEFQPNVRLDDILATNHKTTFNTP